MSFLHYAAHRAALALVATLAACASGDGEAPGAAAPDARATSPSRMASAPDDPCGWIPSDDVATVLGPLNGPPVVVRSAEQLEPGPRGRACLYRLQSAASRGTAAVALEVSMNDGVIAENAFGAMHRQLAAELGGEQGGANEEVPGNSATPAGWDHAMILPPMTYYARQGHIGIKAAAHFPDIERAALESLAVRVRDRMPDLPFQMPPDREMAELAAAVGLPDPEPPSGPDPCALLEREEAEAVLGPLAVPPYRSNGSSPLADPLGESCAYYTTRHRALVLVPTWSDGGQQFRLASGIEGRVSSLLDLGIEAADTLDGPWDDVAMSGATGALRLLKGDRMLEVHFRTSSANASGAVRLARTALGRL